MWSVLERESVSGHLWAVNAAWFSMRWVRAAGVFGQRVAAAVLAQT